MTVQELIKELERYDLQARVNVMLDFHFKDSQTDPYTAIRPIKLVFQSYGRDDVNIVCQLDEDTL
jgi:hypothetical protein